MSAASACKLRCTMLWLDVSVSIIWSSSFRGLLPAWIFVNLRFRESLAASASFVEVVRSGLCCGVSIGNIDDVFGLLLERLGRFNNGMPGLRFCCDVDVLIQGGIPVSTGPTISLVLN